MAVLNISGSTGTLLLIFLMILPLFERYPVLITKALGLFLQSKTFEPSKSQRLFYDKCDMFYNLYLPTGTDYPVRLASLT